MCSCKSVASTGMSSGEAARCRLHRQCSSSSSALRHACRPCCMSAVLLMAKCMPSLELQHGRLYESTQMMQGPVMNVAQG